MRIVIAGGGSVGTAIALDLVDRHHDVTLMEHETEVAEKLRGALHGVNVVAADACDTPLCPRSTFAGPTSSSPPPAMMRTTWW